MPASRLPLPTRCRRWPMTDHPIDADAAKLWLDDPTLDRIIAEVGETITKPDRDVLRHDLLICYGQYSIASGPGRSGFVKRQSERLNSIRKNAKKLVGLLKADDADVGIIRALWPISPERPAHLLPQMIFLVERIDAMTGMEGRPGDIAERTKAKQANVRQRLAVADRHAVAGRLLEAFSSKSREKPKSGR